MGGIGFCCQSLFARSPSQPVYLTWLQVAPVLNRIECILGRKPQVPVQPVAFE